ncbi:MAG: TetR/AcrR family transcriptional regulator [Bacteroidales bacterium]|jgi:AcrR family transcriptional regulator|nr:TetR/AcrR family transcriptional regulator [Bacteroidales bacterium]
MQTKKENIKEDILRVAKAEFYKNGFKNTSMRTIAKKANVGLSNIYNYFRDKDEIFRTVLTPLLTAFDRIMDEHNKPEYISTDIFTSIDYQAEHINTFVTLITNYREDLKLLLYKSHGSSLENFSDEYSDIHTTVGMEYMKQMKDKYPHINNNVSSFFIHIMSSWWITIIGEIVSHDVPEDKIEQFIGEFIEFSTAGWRKIMKA